MEATRQSYLDDYYDANATEATAMLESPVQGVDVLGCGGDEYLDLSKLSTEEISKLRSDWLNELKQVTEEIHTLRQVLASKLRRHHYLKRQIGITPITELKDEIKQSFDNIRSSDAYQKTSAAVKAVKDRTSAVFSEKWGTLKQTNAFKSFEEKVGSAYSTVKNKLVRSPNHDLATSDKIGLAESPDSETLAFSNTHRFAGETGELNDINDDTLAAVSQPSVQPTGPLLSNPSPNNLRTVTLDKKENSTAGTDQPRLSTGSGGTGSPRKRTKAKPVGQSEERAES